MFKLAFNMRCPFCKSTKVTKIKNDLWMHFIPKSNKHECRICSRQFASFWGVSDFQEQRIAERHKLLKGVSVKLSSDSRALLPILNISTSGLLFDITSGMDGELKNKKLTFYLSQQALPLSELSFKVRSVFKVQRVKHGKIHLLKWMSVQFVNLSKKEKIQLDQLIFQFCSDGLSPSAS